MGGEWLKCEWGDIATLEYGRALRDYRSESGAYRVYGTNGPIGWHDEPLCNHPGVIIGRKGAYRGIHYSPEPFFVIDTAFYLEPKQELDLRWAYYCLLTYDINGMDSGSAIPSTSREAFYRLPACVPPLREQRAIACILGSLDDKIELNRRMNRTLEEMARAIFKSWFIDFDPVRAKAAVRREHPKWTDEQVSRAACPKLKPEIARLFPDSFENSELGEIPKGWRVGTFGDIAEHQRRGVQPDSIERHTPYIGLEHMPRRSITLSEWSDADGLESNKFRFKKGEILFGKLRPYFHKVGVAPVDGVCSTDIVVVTPRQQGWFGFVLGHASSERFIEYTNAGSTGTKMPRTSWADMARYKLSVPPEPVTATFTELIQLSIERIVASIQESRTLAALRDALLPKLISGELRIPDAERIAQRCA
jgi:type I restriction enzyme S subunit